MVGMGCVWPVGNGLKTWHREFYVKDVQIFEFVFGVDDPSLDASLTAW